MTPRLLVACHVADRMREFADSMMLDYDGDDVDIAYAAAAGELELTR